MTPPHKNPLSGVTPCEAVARDLRPEGGRYPVLRGTGGEGVPPSLFGEGVGIPPLVFLTGGQGTPSRTFEWGVPPLRDRAEGKCPAS